MTESIAKCNSCHHILGKIRDDGRVEITVTICESSAFTYGYIMINTTTDEQLHVRPLR